MQLDGECRVQKLCSARCPASACSVHASASRIGFPHGNNRQRIVRKSHNLLDYFGLFFQGLKMLLEYMLLLKSSCFFTFVNCKIQRMKMILSKICFFFFAGMYTKQIILFTLTVKKRFVVFLSFNNNLKHFFQSHIPM